MKLRTIFAALVAVSAGVVGTANGQITSIEATGWNQDMVLNNPSPYDQSVDGTMDGGFGSVENWTWVEAGNYTVWNGTEGVADTPIQGLVAGTNTSLTGSGGSFTFQAFDGPNVIGIDGGSPTGSLSLTTPDSYSTLALYGASGGGPTSVDVMLTFDDLTTSTYSIAAGTGIGTDWFDFDGSADKAYAVNGRASNKSEEGYTILFAEENNIISLYESLITLDSADASKTITDVSFTHTGGGRMSIFAISGAVSAVPEPGSALVLGLGLIGVAAARRRRR